MDSQEIRNRRKFGMHLTSKDIFYKYIYPEIKQVLNNYIWVDLYAGEGNLVLPILDFITPNARDDFFLNHIFLFDIQKEMVNKCIKNAESYGISDVIAKQNILIRDNLESFPEFLIQKKFPVYHITNPPYLYLGYIKKHSETQKLLPYFKKGNSGYQDLYQIAMINDLRSEIENLVYIIPSNFLYGASVSNKFRIEFLRYYKIIKMVIFETKIFEFTGTNICIGFFKRKKRPKVEDLTFSGIKLKKQNEIVHKDYLLKYEYKYRAGYEFDEFLKKFRTKYPLKVRYYLLKDKVLEDLGNSEIEVIDANQYINNKYKKLKLKVNEKLKQKLESNILYVRTVDTGSYNGRVGLGIIKSDFNVDGILVSGNTYRTHPIQIFFEPQLSLEDQILLKNYFNFIIELFRELLDSEFLTTYKYSNANYTRKYLGLTQTRKLIETFPYKSLTTNKKESLKKFIKNNELNEILQILTHFK
ncbi:MAG: N-6 DNA methylase [Candidatus Hermodarchaeota archaeon]